MNQFLTMEEKVAVAVSCGIPTKMSQRTLIPNDILAYGDAISNATLLKALAGYDYHRDGTQPRPDQIFVFGSNLAGIHGAGAARAAADTYGAIIGVGTGLQGRSFAIPTKDQRIDTLPFGVVSSFVADFKQYATDNPDKKFFLTRIGCGLAGFTDEQIAPLFKGSPFNCDMPTQWAQYLEPHGAARALVTLYDNNLRDNHLERSMSTDWQRSVAEELIRLAVSLEEANAKLAAAAK